jgi:predicted short-subunit dehydrogenase-like oxidoreductase (DUF2520 family)
MVNYAIMGGGKLARHFSHYFHLLGISHTCWVRDGRSSFNTFDIPGSEQRLREAVARADRVLLLVSDNAIGALPEQYPFLHEKQLIHCSGALSFPGIAGAHPLMTFAGDLYDLPTYQSVPFILETGQDFTQLFPELPNPHFAVNATDKARYHAMCVMAGNFSQVLWQGVSEGFEQRLGLPAETLHPYLKQLAINFMQAPGTSLTGPLARNDKETIQRNLDAMADDPMRDLYVAFIKYYQEDINPNKFWEQAQ